MKRVLVLATNDVGFQGHIYSFACEPLKRRGFDVKFLCLYEESGLADFSFINRNDKVKLMVFRLYRKFLNFLFLHHSKKDYAYLGANIHVGSAKSILKVYGGKPDYVIIGWFDFFLSAKSIYELYQQTHAKIIIVTVDQFLLGGGCHYPFNCKGYEKGCVSCPALTFNKSLAKRVFKKRFQYFSRTPLTIIGTTYDIKRMKTVPFLKNKTFVPNVGVPDIPFVKTKVDARKELGISNDDFLILSGANSLSDPRKGIDLLIKSINYFSETIEDRKVTFLLPGNNAEIIVKLIDSKISVITPGFINESQLFTLYYASDVFVSPSLDDSGPYMVNFAIACGRPVVSFPIGIALDLVVDGKTGFIANYGDSESLAESIRKVYHLSNEELIEISKECNKMMEFYRQRNWINSIVG